MEFWSEGMFITLGEGCQQFGPKYPVELTPKVATFTPRSPAALEGMPPTDGLLAGIVCLWPTLAGSLRDAVVVAHIVGNMEDESVNIQRDWLLYGISLPKTTYFLLVPPEDCRGNIEGLNEAQEKSMKLEGSGQGTTFERMTWPKGII